MPKPSARSRKREESYRNWKKVCVIATEDSNTGAYAYFDELKQHEEKYPFLNRYSFKIAELVPSYDGNSAPNHILKNLRDAITNLSHDGFEIKVDKFWIVCDVDRWPETSIEDVIKECIKQNIQYSFSNPCSEIWILYHQKQFNTIYHTSQECKLAANQLLHKRRGYENVITKSHIKYAIGHAGKAHRPKSDQWPQQQGSHIYN